MSIISESEDIATMTINHYERILRERDEARADAAQLADRLSGLELRTTEELARMERERDEARELLASEKITRDHVIKRGIEVQKERDEAREAIQNLKLQLGLWEDGNLISQETVGEIRLLKEQINGAFRERNEAHKIAERAIDDLAWFNYSNAQRLRAELEQLKEGAK
jgi:hypothetical protein